MDFRHQVNQEPGLRGVVRRILVDAQKTHHAIDQVIERGAEVGRAVVVTSPAVEAEAVVLVFFQRCGIEDAENMLAGIFADLIAYFDGFDVVPCFSCGAPVERVDILQNGEHGFRGKIAAGARRADVVAPGAIRRRAQG